MRALLLVAALAAGDDRHHRNHSRGNWTRAELSVAFTTDLHGEIGALKHAFWLARSLPAPALVVDSGDACVGTAYFRRAGPAGMGRAMRGLGYAALGVGNHDLEFAAELGNLSAAARAPFVSASACRTYDHVRCTRLRRAGDVRVGFLGYTDTATLPGGRACDDATAAAALDDARDLRSRGADVVIALGHCGYDFDLAPPGEARHGLRRPQHQAPPHGPLEHAHVHLQGAAHGVRPRRVREARKVKLRSASASPAGPAARRPGRASAGGARRRPRASRGTRGAGRSSRCSPASSGPGKRPRSAAGPNYATLTGALTLGVLSAPLVDSPTTAAVAAAVGDETAGAKIGPEDRTELLLGDLRRGLADWTASKVDL